MNKTDTTANGIDWRDAIVLLCAAGLLAAFVLTPGAAEPILPDFTPLEPQQRKAEFIGFLNPIVADANRQVLMARQRLAEIAHRAGGGQRLTWHDRRDLRALATRYDVAIEDLRPQDILHVLRRRVDVVPESLVLVQAAKESGWGTSRFALEGNNLFGQRCYQPACGLRPRAAGDARFFVAEYSSVNESVREYVRNLNTHPEYVEFRSLRMAMREAEGRLSGIRLADGLAGYSERGTAYVAEIKAMIRQNGLEP